MYNMLVSYNVESSRCFSANGYHKIPHKYSSEVKIKWFVIARASRYVRYVIVSSESAVLTVGHGIILFQQERYHRVLWCISNRSHCIQHRSLIWPLDSLPTQAGSVSQSWGFRSPLLGSCIRVQTPGYVPKKPGGFFWGTPT